MKKQQQKKVRTDWKGKYEAEVEEKIDWRDTCLRISKKYTDELGVLKEKSHEVFVVGNAVIIFLSVLVLIFLVLWMGTKEELIDTIVHDTKVLNEQNDYLSACSVQLKNVTSLYEARYIEVMNSDVPPCLFFDEGININATWLTFVNSSQVSEVYWDAMNYSER